MTNFAWVSPILPTFRHPFNVRVTFVAIIANPRSSEQACSVDTNMIKDLNIILQLCEIRDTFRNRRYVGFILGASMGRVQHVRGGIITARMSPCRNRPNRSDGCVECARRRGKFEFFLNESFLKLCIDPLFFYWYRK